MAVTEKQNSSDMMIGEGYNLGSPQISPSNIPGFKTTTNFRPKYAATQAKKKGLIARFFSDMSRLGMSYEEDVIKNMRAIPADKNMLPKESQLDAQDLFSQMASGWKVKQNADKNFFEKDFQQKRETLRKLAIQPELEKILDIVCDEAVLYDSDQVYFAEPFVEAQEIKDFKQNVQKDINDKIFFHFRRFYKMLDWKYRAWDDFKRFLVEGVLSWEIVWDSLEKPKQIIGFVPLDPATLTRKFENNKWYWYQFKGIQGRERKLLDSQIIYIAYQETNCLVRQSYLERLVRPFNIYRIVEQAQLIWTITNASYKVKFTIPVKGMNKTTGMQTLSAAMNRYKEDIKFVGDTGELTINGNVNLPFNKEYWFPESESGTPNIETLGGDGPDLSDNDQLKYFKNLLYQASFVPTSRFDQDSGETWFGTDPTSALRTEINFGRFIARLRNVFAQIILKPIQLQLACDMPELRENRQFLNSISLQWNSYNLFEEMMTLEIMQKRVEFIQTMKDSMVDMDKEGNEIKFFSSKFLVQKYLKLSDQDLKLNDKLKQEEIEDLNLAGGDDNEEEGKNDGQKGSGFDLGFGEAQIEKLADMITERLVERSKKKPTKKPNKSDKPNDSKDDPSPSSKSNGEEE